MPKVLQITEQTCEWLRSLLLSFKLYIENNDVSCAEVGEALSRNVHSWQEQARPGWAALQQLRQDPAWCEDH